MHLGILCLAFIAFAIPLAAHSQPVAKLPRIGVLWQATTTIPIVAVVGFPVESGFVKSLARPGGNITGVAVLADVLSMKRLELLKELLPRLSRVAVLWDPVTHEHQPKQVEAAARTLGLQIQILRAQTPEELAPAFEAAAKARAEALLVLVSPMFPGNRPAFASLADPQGRAAGQSAGAAADAIRTEHQPQDRQGARPDDSAVAAIPRRSGR